MRTWWPPDKTATPQCLGQCSASSSMEAQRRIPPPPCGQKQLPKSTITDANQYKPTTNGETQEILEAQEPPPAVHVTGRHSANMRSASPYRLPYNGQAGMKAITITRANGRKSQRAGHVRHTGVMGARRRSDPPPSSARLGRTQPSTKKLHQQTPHSLINDITNTQERRMVAQEPPKSVQGQSSLDV